MTGVRIEARSSTTGQCHVGYRTEQGDDQFSVRCSTHKTWTDPPVCLSKVPTENIQTLHVKYSHNHKTCDYSCIYISKCLLFFLALVASYHISNKNSQATCRKNIQAFLEEARIASLTLVAWIFLNLDFLLI